MDKQEYFKRWLWHAFNALDKNTGTVDPSELKVLTAHVGASLGANNTGNIAHKVSQKYSCDSTFAVCFGNYLEFLNEQNFLTNENVDAKKLEETCWMLSRKLYEDRPHNVINNQDLLKLWKIFNFLAEPNKFPYTVVREEMTLLIEKLVVAMGVKWDLAKFDYATKDLKLFTFTQLVCCFETVFARDCDPQCISEAIMAVYDEIIEEVEMKGLLLKKGHKIKSWKERWFVLKPGCLSYYTSRSEKDKKGDVLIRASWKTEIIPDQKNYKHLFVLCNDDKYEKEKSKYELSAPEPRMRQTWIIALKAVIERERTQGLGQYGELLKRRARRRKEEAELEEEHMQQVAQTQRKARERAAREEKEMKDEKLRQQEMEKKEKAEKELEMLQKARLEAELVAQKEAELQRLKEMEEEERRRLDSEERERQAKELERVRGEQLAAEQRAEKELQLRRAKEEEDEMTRIEYEQLRAEQARELEELKNACADASERAKREEELRKAEEERYARSEELRRHLEKLLEDSKRAKMEEESIRALKQRLLEEEIEKRQELEKLKEEQAQMLLLEQERRENLQVMSEDLILQRQNQEALLEKERQKLAELENERAAADQQLKVAMEKISLAEKEKERKEKLRQELLKPVGLARLVHSTPKCLITHRAVFAMASDYPNWKKPSQEQETPTNGTDDDQVVNASSNQPGINGEEHTNKGMLASLPTE